MSSCQAAQSFKAFVRRKSSWSQWTLGARLLVLLLSHPSLELERTRLKLKPDLHDFDCTLHTRLWRGIPVTKNSRWHRQCKESHGFWWILTDFAYVRWVLDPLKSFNLISFHLIWSGVVLIELALSSHLQILQPRRLALNLWRPAGTRSCTRILDWTCW